jgi:hypothetical protein
MAKFNKQDNTTVIPSIAEMCTNYASYVPPPLVLEGVLFYWWSQYKNV